MVEELTQNAVLGVAQTHVHTIGFQKHGHVVDSCERTTEYISYPIVDKTTHVDQPSKVEITSVKTNLSRCE
jgi:hypothetical protein